MPSKFELAQDDSDISLEKRRPRKRRNSPQSHTSQRLTPGQCDLSTPSSGDEKEKKASYRMLTSYDLELISRMWREGFKTHAVARVMQSTLRTIQRIFKDLNENGTSKDVSPSTSIELPVDLPTSSHATENVSPSDSPRQKRNRSKKKQPSLSKPSSLSSMHSTPSTSASLDVLAFDHSMPVTTNKFISQTSRPRSKSTTPTPSEVEVPRSSGSPPPTEQIDSHTSTNSVTLNSTVNSNSNSNSLGVNLSALGLSGVNLLGNLGNFNQLHLSGLNNFNNFNNLAGMNGSNLNNFNTQSIPHLAAINALNQASPSVPAGLNTMQNLQNMGAFGGLSHMSSIASLSNFHQNLSLAGLNLNNLTLAMSAIPTNLNAGLSNNLGAAFGGVGVNWNNPLQLALLSSLLQLQNNNKTDVSQTSAGNMASTPTVNEHQELSHIEGGNKSSTQSQPQPQPQGPSQVQESVQEFDREYRNESSHGSNGNGNGNGNVNNDELPTVKRQRLASSDASAPLKRNFATTTTGSSTGIRNAHSSGNSYNYDYNQTHPDYYYSLESNPSKIPLFGTNEAYNDMNVGTGSDNLNAMNIVD